MEKINVHLVDDHSCIKEALDAHLRDTAYEIRSHATCCRDALQLLESEPMDLAVIDLRLPDGSGEDLIPAYRRKHPCLPILVFTAVLDLRTAKRCLDSGANGFFIKPSRIAEFRNALDTIWVRKSVYLCLPIQNGLTELQNIPSSKLSDRERQILGLIVHGNSSKQIASSLRLSAHTANNHRRNLCTNSVFVTLPHWPVMPPPRDWRPHLGCSMNPPPPPRNIKGNIETFRRQNSGKFQAPP